MSVYEILTYLSNHFDKYGATNYAYAKFNGNCEIDNFIKLSNKYEHTKFIQGIPNAIRSCGKFNYENKINLNNYIKRIPYKDDDINIENENENGTGPVNIIKEKINERNKRLKMKLGGKSTEMAIKMAIKMKKANERQMMSIEKAIGKPVRINIKFNDISNMNGEVYQLGLRIGNKNTKTMEKLIQSFNKLKLKESIKNKNEEYINQYVSLKLVGKLDKMNTMNSNIEVDLQTNTTTEKNGFWFYFLIIIKENQEMVVSEAFTLMSYKQLTKRKEKSFLKKQEEYMLNNENSIFPYYFESMFHYNVEDNQYMLKQIFTFGINFFEEIGNENNNYNEKVMINKNENKNENENENENENMELKQEIEEYMNDFKQIYPIFSGITNENNIPNENNNIDGDKVIDEDKVIITGFPNSPLMSNVINDNECLSLSSNDSNELSNNGYLSFSSYPTYPSYQTYPSYPTYPSPSSDSSDICSNNDIQPPLSLSSQLSSQYSFTSPSYNLDKSYIISSLLSLICDQKCIINELNRLEIERNKLIYMNNNDINESGVLNEYNIILNQQEVLLQKLEEGKKEKEYLEEIIYNNKIIDFSKVQRQTQKDETLLSYLNF